MASIRRSLSPLPGPRALLNREACLVSSPLSKSSSCTDNDPSSAGLLCAVDSQDFVFSVFSTRASRVQDKLKLKGKTWRRALFHFFVCFAVGVFIGITPLLSIDSSVNLTQNHQLFSFDMISSLENVGQNNVTFDLPANKSETLDGFFATTSDSKTFLEESSIEIRKLLIIVTPTYNQPFQAYNLKRLAHTLKLVPPPLLWIVVEVTSQSEETADILRRTGVMYRHLVCNKNLTDVIDRRIEQRNTALSHIEKHHLDGIVYFADEDNIYSTNLFEHMRDTRRFGTWPVAQLIGDKSKAIWGGPVCNGTNVIGWHLDRSSRRFQAYRRFHTEMSGFAFNSTILWDPKRWHRPLEPIRQLASVKDGSQVSEFVEKVVEDESQMECLLPNFSSIMVWRVQLESSIFSYPNDWVLKSNLNVVTPFSQHSRSKIEIVPMVVLDTDGTRRWLMRKPLIEAIVGLLLSDKCHFEQNVKIVNMSEWLRRQIRNLLGIACAGSNPAVDEF
ncbi:hypothetical protein ACFE04_011790 [Oxalis oulophora]